MRNIIKIFLSFLLIYEPLAYWILADDYGACRDLLTRSVCNADSRFFWFMGLPIIFMAIYLMWEKQIRQALGLKQNKNITKKDKQSIVGPFQSCHKLFYGFSDYRGCSQRSEYFWGLIIVSLFVYFCTIFCVVAFSSIGYIISILISIVVPIMYIQPLVARRMRDIGVDGSWSIIFTALDIFAVFYPLTILVLIVPRIVLLFCPSKLRNNPYRDKSTPNMFLEKLNSALEANALDDD